MNEKNRSIAVKSRNEFVLKREHRPLVFILHAASRAIRLFQLAVNEGLQTKNVLHVFHTKTRNNILFYLTLNQNFTSTDKIKALEDVRESFRRHFYHSTLEMSPASIRFAI